MEHYKKEIAEFIGEELYERAIDVDEIHPHRRMKLMNRVANSLGRCCIFFQFMLYVKLYS